GIAILMEAFAGVLCAVYLAAVTAWVSERTAVRYRWSLAAVIAAHIVVAAGGGYLLANRLSEQVGQMTQELPQSLEAIRNYLMQYGWGKLVLDLMPAPGDGGTFADVNPFTHLTGLISGVGGFLEA